MKGSPSKWHIGVDSTLLEGSALATGSSLSGVSEDMKLFGKSTPYRNALINLSVLYISVHTRKLN